MVTQVTLTASASHGLRMPVGLSWVSMEFGGVGKTLQHGIVPGRLEQFQEGPEDSVQRRVAVPDVEIERIEGAAKVELRLVVQRAAAVTLQPLGKRPAQHVAQRVNIELEIESHAGIEA